MSIGRKTHLFSLWEMPKRMKKSVSLLMVLLFSTSLAVPVLADVPAISIFQNGNVFGFSREAYAAGLDTDSSGDGWSYNINTDTLTLNNFEGNAIYLSPAVAKPRNGSYTVNLVLANGSVNKISGQLNVQCAYFSGTQNLNISGKGTLIIDNTKQKNNDYYDEAYYNAALLIDSYKSTRSKGTITLDKGLIITGGTQKGEQGLLTLNANEKDEENFSYGYPKTANGEIATYVVISPPGTSVVDPASLPTAFRDVPDGAYYVDAVKWAVAQGVTNGTSATTFEPSSTCTRGQVATFLWRANGSPEPKTTVNPFSDVQENSAFYKAILWAHENNITTGTSATTFSPSNLCTRAHVLTFLYRFEGEPTTENSILANTVPQGYYTNALAWADRAEILTNINPSTFDPSSLCSRADIVTYLYRDLKE